MTPPHAGSPSPMGDTLPARLLGERLLPRDEWRPFPPAADRASWDALPADVRRSLAGRAERRLGYRWPELPATLFLEYRRTDRRVGYERPHFARRQALRDLVLGECDEGRGRFLDDIVDGVWAICEESFWGVPAHNGPPRPSGTPGLPDTAVPYLDLFAAETAGLLAWTHWLLADVLGDHHLPVVSDRIVAEVQTRVLRPYRERDDWWWLGRQRPADPTQVVNNWNPWIHSNVLAANLLLEPDEAVRTATVARAVEGLGAFLATYHDDGGCDEGISYWQHAGGSLFECLELLASALGGDAGLFELPLVREIGRFVYRMHVGGRWYVNFADGSAVPHLDGPLVSRYGQRIGDDRLVGQGRSMGTTEEADGPCRSLALNLSTLFPAGVPEPTTTAPLIRDAWLDGTGVLVARERAGTTDGLFLAAKGGHNNESHNHNDVGNIIVALDGAPVVIDVGVGTYTRQTFGPNRYDTWTMQSAWHNLPLIDGHQQSAGAEFRARDISAAVGDDQTEISLDLAPAWPEDAGVRSWRRTVRLERGDPARIVLADRWDLVSAPSDVTLALMVSGDVAANGPGRLSCSGAGGGRPLDIVWDPDALALTVEPVDLDDERLMAVWGERIHRLRLSASHPTAQGDWTLTMTAGT